MRAWRICAFLDVWQAQLEAPTFGHGIIQFQVEALCCDFGNGVFAVTVMEILDANVLIAQQNRTAAGCVKVIVNLVCFSGPKIGQAKNRANNRH